jgi:sporulation protein YlmC with PRC-barrel domain
MSSRLFSKDEVEGKTVIYSTGRVAGKVKDVVFGLDGTLLLVVQKDDGTESRVPMNAVLGVGEYVVVRYQSATSVAMGVQPPVADQAMGSVCKFCGAAMPAGSVYCPSCDRSQV